MGHLTVQIAELPANTNPPPEPVKDWAMIQHEDALIGEGGSDVIRLMGPTGPSGPAGPDANSSSAATRGSSSADA